MGKASRRKSERTPEQRHQHTLLNGPALIAVVGLIIAIIVTIVVRINQSLPIPSMVSATSPSPTQSTVAPPRAHPEYPGYLLVQAAPREDPVVRTTFQFGIAYVEWSKAHPKPQRMEGLEMLRTLHNRFAPTFRALDIDFKAHESGKIDYAKLIAPLRDAMYQRNWSIWAFVPVKFPGVSAWGANLRFARIVARRTGELRDMNNRAVQFVEEIVDPELTVLGGSTYSITEPEYNRITHFLYEWGSEADEVIAALHGAGAQAKPGSTAWVAWCQWQHLLLAGDPATHRQNVLNDLLEASSVHERQHLYDHSWTTAVHMHDSRREGVRMLRFFIELRGMLRATADGPVPLFVLHYNSQVAQRAAVEPELVEASRQTALLMNQPRPLVVDLDHPELAFSEIRSRAQRFLAITNKYQQRIGTLPTQVNPSKETATIISACWREYLATRP